MKKGNPWALLPILCFLVVFIGMGVWLNDFYAMPAIVGFLIALGVAFCQNRKRSFSEKMEDVTHSMGDSNVMIMCLVFVMAGGFSGAVQAAGGVDSTVNFSLSILPPSVAVAGLFIIGCFISTAMGTSVGTIAALAPIAVGISDKTGIAGALCIGAVVSGAMFGDNLSFISDTTIAATRTQEVSMKDKFKANILMVLPAVVINVILLAIQSGGDVSLGNIGSFSFVNIIPYILVIALSLVGLNVVVVMIIGILSGVVIGCFHGGFTLIQSLTIIHDGAIGMEDMALIAVMVGGMVELMKHFGGMDFLMNQLTKGAKSSRGGELSIAALVSLLDIATTNNTISIIAAGPIARDIADNFHISRSRVASILDLFSSAFNGLLPYAGQLLVAGGLANVSPTAIMGYNWYSMLMIVFGIVFIIIGFPKFKDIRTKKEQVEKEA